MLFHWCCCTSKVVVVGQSLLCKLSRMLFIENSFSPTKGTSRNNCERWTTCNDGILYRIPNSMVRLVYTLKYLRESLDQVQQITCVSFSETMANYSDSCCCIKDFLKATRTCFISCISEDKHVEFRMYIWGFQNQQQ